MSMSLSKYYSQRRNQEAQRKKGKKLGGFVEGETVYHARKLAFKDEIKLDGEQEQVKGNDKP